MAPGKLAGTGNRWLVLLGRCGGWYSVLVGTVFATERAASVVQCFLAGRQLGLQWDFVDFISG
jgi:hypothetical protein